MKEAVKLNGKEVRLIIDKLTEQNHLLADILARTIVDEEWHKTSAFFDSITSAIQQFESEEQENKIPPLEEGIDPTWINGFKGCI